MGHLSYTGSSYMAVGHINLTCSYLASDEAGVRAPGPLVFYIIPCCSWAIFLLYVGVKYFFISLLIFPRLSCWVIDMPSNYYRVMKNGYIISRQLQSCNESRARASVEIMGSQEVFLCLLLVSYFGVIDPNKPTFIHTYPGKGVPKSRMCGH